MIIVLGCPKDNTEQSARAPCSCLDGMAEAPVVAEAVVGLSHGLHGNYEVPIRQQGCLQGTVLTRTPACSHPGVGPVQKTSWLAGGKILGNWRAPAGYSLSFISS